MRELEVNGDIEKQVDKFIGHLKILADLSSIECDDARLGFRNQHPSGFVMSEVKYRLTSTGYELLEAIQDNTLLDKIKNSIKNVTTDTIKQIPALAVQLLLQLKNSG